MFVVDLSQSMAKTRTVEVPSDDGIVTIEMTNLEWGLQYVKLKIQEMVRRASPDHETETILRFHLPADIQRQENGPVRRGCIRNTRRAPLLLMSYALGHLTSRLRDRKHPQ